MSGGPREPHVRPDSRAEPEDPADSDHPSSGSIRLHEDQVSLPSGRPPMTALKPKRPTTGSKEGFGDAPETEGASAADEADEPPVEKKRGPAITNVDPRLAELEPLIQRGDWAAVAKQLGPFDKAGALQPQLGLMYAIAVNETPSEEAEGASALAIRCVASMCGVPETSGFALVIAKRLLRKNPTSFRKKQAPPAKTSFLIVAITLILGSAIGYILSSGKIHLPH